MRHPLAYRVVRLPAVFGLRLLLALVSLRLALLQLDPVGGAVGGERVDLVLALMHLVRVRVKVRFRVGVRVS